MRVELDLPLKRGHVLGVNLEGHCPEGSPTDETALPILQSYVIRLFEIGGGDNEVEVVDVEPEGNDHEGRDGGSLLEPTLGVAIIEGESKLRSRSRHTRKPWELSSFASTEKGFTLSDAFIKSWFTIACFAFPLS